MSHIHNVISPRQDHLSTPPLPAVVWLLCNDDGLLRGCSMSTTTSTRDHGIAIHGINRDSFASLAPQHYVKHASWSKCRGWTWQETIMIVVHQKWQYNSHPALHSFVRRRMTKLWKMVKKHRSFDVVFYIRYIQFTTWIRSVSGIEIGYCESRYINFKQGANKSHHGQFLCNSQNPGAFAVSVKQFPSVFLPW